MVYDLCIEALNYPQWNVLITQTDLYTVRGFIDSYNDSVSVRECDQAFTEEIAVASYGKNNVSIAWTPVLS